MKTQNLTITRNVVCGHCNGTGVIEESEHLGHGRTRETERKCEDCDGGGMLTIYKSIRIEIHPKHAQKPKR